MAVAPTTSAGPFGSATDDDLEALDAAMVGLRAAEAELEKARGTVRRALVSLLEKGAKRRHLARRADVSDQTITHMAYGRSKSE